MNEHLIRKLTEKQAHRLVGFILGIKVFEASNHSCGDEITLQGEQAGGKIEKIVYKGSACSICLASAEFLCQEIEGKLVSAIDTEKEKKKLLATFSLQETDKRASCALLPYRALEQLKKELLDI